MDYLIQSIFLGHRSLAQRDSEYEPACDTENYVGWVLSDKSFEVGTASKYQFDADEWTEAGYNVCWLSIDDKWKLINCLQAAESLEDFTGCIHQVNWAGYDQSEWYNSREAPVKSHDQENDYDSEEADEEEDDQDVDYDSEEADEEEDVDYDSEEADE